MGKIVISKIFIKSVVDQKNLKLGVVIAWTISIVQKKNSIAIERYLKAGIQFFGPYFAKGLYSSFVAITSIKTIK